jgi:Trk K+ transport system NAD-binding subunit
VVAKQVLGFLSDGPIVSKTPLSEGSGLSVLEIDVMPKALATEHVLANLGLPAHCLIAGVIREGFASVPGGDNYFEAGDTVIALVADNVIGKVEEFFKSPRG